ALPEFLGRQGFARAVLLPALHLNAAHVAARKRAFEIRVSPREAGYFPVRVRERGSRLLGGYGVLCERRKCDVADRRGSDADYGGRQRRADQSGPIFAPERRAFWILHRLLPRAPELSVYNTGDARV